MNQPTNERFPWLLIPAAALALSGVTLLAPAPVPRAASNANSHRVRTEVQSLGGAAGLLLLGIVVRAKRRRPESFSTLTDLSEAADPPLRKAA